MIKRHKYWLKHAPKQVQEAMCVVEQLILMYRPQDKHYATIIGDLIKECQRKRPTGPNGKHGKLHTDECGCDDVPLDVPFVDRSETEVIQEIYDEVPIGVGKEEKVDHPAHYNVYKGLEVIDLVEQMNFNRGNAVKYIARAGLKDPQTTVEDLKKAKWYINREIQRLQGESSE